MRSGSCRGRAQRNSHFVLDAHIDTTAAHGRAEVVMPVGAVKGVSRFEKKKMSTAHRAIHTYGK